MMVKPLNLLRYVLLIVFAVSNVSLVRAHDWSPFHVDCSERFHTQVRYEPPGMLASYATAETAAGWLSNLTAQWGEYVSRKTSVVDRSLAKYCVLPDLYPAQQLNEVGKQLVVRQPSDGVAPQPTVAMDKFIVYSEHCLSETYLPFDNAFDGQQFRTQADVDSATNAIVSSWIADKLSRLSAWHCELIEECHSGQLATDFGSFLASQRIDRSTESDVAKGMHTELNDATLPKFVYLNTRGGIVLAPAELASGWDATEPAIRDSRPVMLFEAANDLRAMASAQLEGIAESLISVARILAPSSDVQRVARGRTESQRK